jgi:hypothetical protein
MSTFNTKQPDLGRRARRTTGAGRRMAAVVAALTLGATACVSSGRDEALPPTTDLSGNEILLTSALETVDSCDALLDRIKSEALERVGPYGFGNGFYGPVAFGLEEEMMADDEAMEDSADAMEMAASTTAEADTGGESRSGGGDDFSETNNQEQGVDEADLVKTDGKRLVSINGNQLRIVDVDQDTPELTKTVRLPEEFWGGELFLNGDTALLMTSGWTQTPFVGRDIASDWYPGSPTGRVMEIDMVNGTIERTLEFEGGYLSAREIDGSIRIVMSATENRFNFVYPSNNGAEEAAENANRDLIENSTIDMWIPTYQITEDGETVSDGQVVDCDRVHLPTEFAGFGSLVVMTANIDEGLRIDDSLSVFTDGQTVYASQDRLAVAAPRWPEFNEDGEAVDTEGYRTALHTFDISDPFKTEYAASGTVRGFLLNRFSMSEYEGYLRIATTDGTPWDSRESESYVTVLQESDGELSEVGQVGGLGFGEQIFAVRFLGDKGYVVTFEQIDPLYTIDLSDPTNPEVKGELKITGVSDYLHPYGNDLVIGVGRSGNENGLTGTVAVSVFDVSDPTNPTRIDNIDLGIKRPQDERNGWAESYSPVSYDPRAFTMWGDIMIVPIGWWSSFQDENGFQEDNGNAAILIKIDEDSGQLTKIGEIGHPMNRECEGRAIPIEDGPGGVVVRRGDAAGLATTSVDVDLTTVDDSTDDEEPTTVDEGTGDAEASFATDDEAEAMEDEEALLAPISPDGEQFCWSFQPEIRRSVIIGDNLYTVSDSGIAVNDFDSLDTVTWIPFDR